MPTSEASSGILQIVLEYHENLKSIHFIEGDKSLSEPLYSISQQALLDYYDTHEIDYARIIMMTGIPRVDPIEPVIHAHQIKSGDPIFTVGESPVYPEDVIKLKSASNSFKQITETNIRKELESQRCA